jgi:hypothetical protein
MPTIPNVINLSDAIANAILMLGSIVAAVVGGHIAFLIIKKALNWSNVVSGGDNSKMSDEEFISMVNSGDVTRSNKMTKNQIGFLESGSYASM